MPLIPPAYHHWIPAIIRLTIKSVAVFIAWQLQIVISAVQSALRGGRLAARKTLAYCDRHGYLRDPNPSPTLSPTPAPRPSPSPQALALALALNPRPRPQP